MKDATRSTAEWIASVTIATEPVITPAMSLSTISAALEAIEISAARVRWPRIIGRSHSASARAARPRCEIASFSASVSSAIVRPSPSSGTNSGS